VWRVVVARCESRQPIGVGRIAAAPDSGRPLLVSGGGVPSISLGHRERRGDVDQGGGPHLAETGLTRWSTSKSRCLSFTTGATTAPWRRQVRDRHFNRGGSTIRRASDAITDRASTDGRAAACMTCPGSRIHSPPRSSRYVSIVSRLPDRGWWCGCTCRSSSLAALFSHRLRHDLRLNPYCRRAAGVWLDRAGTLVKVIAVELGIIERPLDRGGHSVYASVVTIDSSGKVSRGQGP
jgi:hypothetical protein